VKREKLSQDELHRKISELDGWSAGDAHVAKRVKFDNFAESLEFVNRVGELAEAADHHPVITFGWGYAEISLTTHDRGGVTDVDIELAKQIDAIG
jgi:4a-hydroxytetrahydrobiopterin dehydratase